MATGTIPNLAKQTTGSGTATNEYNVRCDYNWIKTGNVVVLNCSFKPATAINNGTGNIELSLIPTPLITRIVSTVFGEDGSAAEQKGSAMLNDKNFQAIGARTANKAYCATFTYITNE